MQLLRSHFALSVLLAMMPTARCWHNLKPPRFWGPSRTAPAPSLSTAKSRLKTSRPASLSSTQSERRRQLRFHRRPDRDVSAEGRVARFQDRPSPEFTVAVSARQRVDLTLEVGDVTQTVAVKDTVAMLETDSSDRGQVINNATVVNLPLNGRNYSDLALLAPGVRKSFLGMDPNNSNFREGSFNVNGQRSALQ